MRLVKPVSGEFLHQIKDVLRGFLLHPSFPGALKEFGALLGHGRGVLLAHGPAKDVPVSQGISGQNRGDFHHLFLVQNNPVGLL